MANKVGGVNMLQFCSVSNSLSHTTLSIKWEVHFSKRLCRSSLLCRRYVSAHEYSTLVCKKRIKNIEKWDIPWHKQWKENHLLQSITPPHDKYLKDAGQYNTSKKIMTNSQDEDTSRNRLMSKKKKIFFKGYRSVSSQMFEYWAKMASFRAFSSSLNCLLFFSELLVVVTWVLHSIWDNFSSIVLAFSKRKKKMLNCIFHLKHKKLQFDILLLLLSKGGWNQRCHLLSLT